MITERTKTLLRLQQKLVFARASVQAVVREAKSSHNLYDLEVISSLYTIIERLSAVISEVKAKHL